MENIKQTCNYYTFKTSLFVSKIENKLKLSSDKATLTPWFRVPWRPAPKNLKYTKFIVTCRLRPLSDSSIRMTDDLYTENSRVHRLLSGIEEMRFIFSKIINLYYNCIILFLSKNISLFNNSILFMDFNIIYYSNLENNTKSFANKKTIFTSNIDSLII